MGEIKQYKENITREMKKRFDNKKIGYRMRQLFVFITTLIAVVAIFSLLIIRDLSVRIKQFNEISMEIVDESWSARRNLLGAQSSIYKLCLTKNEELNRKYTQEEEEQKDLLISSLSRLQELTPENKELLNETEEMINSLVPIRAKVLEYGNHNQVDEAVAELEENYVPMIEKINSNLLAIADKAHAEADLYAENSHKRYQASFLLIIFILIFSIYASFRSSKRMIHGIVDPLHEVEAAMDQIAEGNLGFELDYHSNNEIGHLAHKIRSTVKELKKYIENIDQVLGAVSNKDFTATIDIYYKGDFYNIKESIGEILKFLNGITSKIRKTADVVTDSSMQIEQVSHTLAEGTTEQSGIVEELSATIANVLNQVNENARKASLASEKSIEASQVIDRGNEYMQELVEAMDAITETSRQISNLISVIEGISDQTNLLAVNASIEAARAGEHGKGFAVVAREIGQLANRTNDATKTSTELIERSLQAVDNGGKRAAETARVLKEVVSSAGEITEIANDVSEASSAQAESLGEINLAVEQISQVVQKESSIAQEAAASSEDLTAEAKNLDEMMMQFKLR